MNSPNHHPGRRSNEMPTQQRYRISLEGMEYQDYTHRHPAGLLRFVSYERGNDLEDQTRARLSQLGLILGSALPTTTDDEVVSYRIPTSSRPIGLDASASSVADIEHPHKYSDKDLFKDAAELLGALATVRKNSQVGYVHRLGQLLVTTEFTDPDERKLFLAPGVERVLRTTDNDPVTIAINYRERMQEEFGKRFEPYSTNFEGAFLQATK